jgi:hypothetical protein
MAYILKTSRRRRFAGMFRADAVTSHLASALVGQTVSLLTQAHTVSHGVVAGVLNETGRPKLVVNRHEYDLSQVLSVTPPVFN